MDKFGSLKYYHYLYGIEIRNNKTIKIMKTILFWITVVYSIFTILWGGADYLADWITPMIVLMLMMWAIIYKTYSKEDFEKVFGRSGSEDYKF